MAKRQAVPVFGVVYFLLFFFLAKADAATSTNASVIASATIPSALTLNVTILDQTTSAVVPTMNFGELERIGTEFRSLKFFKVLLEVDTVGDSLRVIQLASPLTRNGGSEALPNGAYIVAPEYNESDNDSKPLPPGTQLDLRRTVVGTHEIYSDPSGSHRTIALIYRLSGDPATGGTEVIPVDQKSGAYSGTIQYTLTSD